MTPWFAIRSAVAGEETPAEVREAAHHGLGRMLAQANGSAADAPDLDYQIGEIMAADRWIRMIANRFERR